MPDSPADRLVRRPAWWLGSVRAAFVLLLAWAPAHAADIDVYAGGNSGGAPNVLFFLDNSASWSNQSQAWAPQDSWNKCKDLSAAAVADCRAAIEEVFYGPGSGNQARTRPWQAGFSWNSNWNPTQGQVELRAIRFVLRELVCNTNPTRLSVNIGLSMFSPGKGSALNNGHPTAFIYQAVKAPTEANCTQILNKLDAIDANINSPTTKAPQDANYSAALFEAFKYFGGYTNPSLAGAVPSTPGSPVGAAGYGPQRFSVLQTLDDPDAFTSAARTTYRSPLDNSLACGNNYLVFVGNTYPKAEPNNGGPVRFNGLNYTFNLTGPTSDTNRFADEWAHFLANTDIHSSEGVQRLFSYVVNVYNDKPDADQVRLTRSMAAVGGVGAAGYIEVGGDLLKLVTAFRELLTNIAAVNSVFAATTLPVSTTTQGTYLNQIFIGKFRPDASGRPRWVGNLKQYQLGISSLGTLDLFDARGRPAVLADTGFIAPTAESFWTTDSVFFAASPSGTPASRSDLPDGPVVEKGGVAQRLRVALQGGAGPRKVYTLPAGTTAGLLSAHPFTTATVSPAQLDPSVITWARGENNVASGDGMEEFNGSVLSGTNVTPLGSTGPRHAIHGDVLHSRPVALNYGGDDVVVFYGANDGFFRAVDGRQTGDGGSERWSFVAPEHYELIKRHHAGTVTLHLPETNSAGGTIPTPAGKAPKAYGMDGPIGVYAKYVNGAIGASGSQAIIYPTMRRGGRAVYAIDVTNPNVPSVLWKISGGAGDFTKLAQTWSMPRAVVLPDVPTMTGLSAGDPIVLMGGGYDPAEDTNGSSSIGNVVYVINGRTGVLLKELPTDYSVPSDITVVDANLDGKIDRGYVGDVRGNLYRIEMTVGGVMRAPSEWTIRKIATIGGKIFHAPDVVATTRYISVLVGTGDREKPLMITTVDHFVMVKDTLIGATERAAPLTLADMARIGRVNSPTDASWEILDPVPNPNNANGCYLALATNGEKVVNTPFTIAGATYFGTNRPNSSSPTSCSAGLGVARAYRFPLFCGQPTSNRLEGVTMPPSPVGGLVTIKVDGKDQLVPFLIGGGAGGSAFSPEQPKPPVAPVRTRQHWRIDNGNR